MRYLLLILLSVRVFAFETPWEYECADTTPVGTYQIRTIPLSGSYGVGISDPIYISTPRVCTNTYPEGWYSEDTYACFYVQGQRFDLVDSLGTWDVGFLISPDNDYRDTVSVCHDDLLSSEWATRVIDTVYSTFVFGSWIDNARAISQECGEVGNPGCDSCAFIIYCDTTATLVYDSLSIQRPTPWPHFYQVEWFIRQMNGDSFYFDTLRYVTEGDTKLYANRIPFTVLGTTASGTAEITGWRSAGMDVYADGARVVSSVDSEEIGLSNIPFSFNWTGLQPSVVESLQIWGISDGGNSSDTTTLRRRYLNTNEGQFHRR